MARKLIQYVEMTDDFDRSSPADETIELGIDGAVYELDLTSVRAKELREFLVPYQEAAHDQWKMPARPRKKRKSHLAQAVTEVPKARKVRGSAYSELLTDREARNRIRDWAEENGWELARTGKIAVEILEAFREENPDAYIPETTLIDAGLQ